MCRQKKREILCILASVVKVPYKQHNNTTTITTTRRHPTAFLSSPPPSTGARKKAKLRRKGHEGKDKEGLPTRLTLSLSLRKSISIAMYSRNDWILVNCDQYAELACHGGIDASNGGADRLSHCPTPPQKYHHTDRSHAIPAVAAHPPPAVPPPSASHGLLCPRSRCSNLHQPTLLLLLAPSRHKATA